MKSPDEEHKANSKISSWLSESTAARLISNPLLLLCILQDKMFQQQLISLGKFTLAQNTSNNFSSVSGSSILDEGEKITRF